MLERAVAARDSSQDESIDIVTAWALVHGLATLIIDGQLGVEANELAAAAELTRSALYLRGGARSS